MSLVERFIFPNMAERLVVDLLFFTSLLSDFVGDREPYRLFAVGLLLRFEGEEGGDWALECRSPRIRVLAWCGWSGGRRGTVWVRALYCSPFKGASEVMSGETGRDLDETSDLRNLEDLLRRCCGRSGTGAC
jgi:hypothetical protein